MADAGADDGRIRVSKILAQRGIASRSEADRLIERGAVEVDGRIAMPGDRALPDAQIRLSDAAAAQIGDAFTVILNKPRGFVSAEDETGGARAAGLLVTANFAGDGEPPAVRDPALRVAGRLSAQDRGLVIYTTDSALARRLAAADVRELWRVDFADSPQPAAAQIVAALQTGGREPEQVQLDGQRLQLQTASLGKGQLSSLCRDLGVAANVTRLRRGDIVLPDDLGEGRWMRASSSAAS